MENLIEKLKKFRDIQPEADYGQRSKLAILATPISLKEENPVFKLTDNITEILKRLRQIQPEAEYGRLSKLAILGVPVLPQKRLSFNWQLAFTVAGLLLVLISGSLIHNLKPGAPNLNAQALETELQNLNINIQLAKIEYSQKIDETVSLALKEISENQTSHFNPLILESEQDKLNAEPSNNKEIEELLDQLLL